ncbi:hypothetical protein [Nostoc sp.]|uniref:hypothetical protein n=1 Tax=Nostoc sp. TaxID=1180 RepID=UPI002FF72650
MNAHACQLKIKASLEQAFTDCLVPSLRLGMPNGRVVATNRGDTAISSNIW